MTASPSLGTLLRTGPFHTALRAAIQERGLTLDRLRIHLARRGVSVGLSTLSNWQAGHVRPMSPSAVTALEEILCLPGGSLTDLLAVTGPGGWPEELRDLRPGFRANDLEIVLRNDKVIVQADRRAIVTRVHAVVRARRDGVDRYAIHAFSDNPSPVILVPQQHCHLGRTFYHDMTTVGELLVGHTLNTGETRVFEFEVHDPGTDVTLEYWLCTRGFSEHSLIEVRFHPGVLPVECHAYVQYGDDEPQRVAELTPADNGTVHHLETSVQATWVGIRWQWPPQDPRHLVAVSILIAAVLVPQHVSAAAPSHGSSSEKPRTVTLITGDQVQVIEYPDGHKSVRITPARHRERPVPFRQSRTART